MSKFNNQNHEIFGKYCKIPMNANGDKHIFKCIGSFQSNTYMDVPICPYHEMTMHDNIMDVANVIHCGIDETKVIRVALKDIEIIEEPPKVNQWIPVEERLPEDTGEDYYQTVIVTLLNGRVAPGVYRNHEDEWVAEDETGANEYMFHDEVIAWMPLPEPHVEVE